MLQLYPIMYLFSTHKKNIDFSFFIMYTASRILNAPVAQLDRASDYGSEGCGFDSYRAHHLTLSATHVASKQQQVIFHTLFTKICYNASILLFLWRFILLPDNRGSQSEKHRLNSAITASSVRLIDVDGTPVGIVSIREALQIAKDRNLDLVEVSPQATPPVCKILDYGKLKYDLQKKKSDAKKKQKTIEIKEIKFTTMIGANDMKVKINAIKKFIAAGNKVKVSLKFRGREISHQDLGEKVLRQIAAEVSDVAVPENELKLDGRQIFIMLAPIQTK